MVEVNNKIVLIGGSFEEPEIYCVLAINANNETMAEIYKEIIYYEQESYKTDKSEYSYGIRLSEVIIGSQSVRNYESADFRYYKECKDTGERAILPSNFQNCGYTKQFQNGGGNYTETGQDISNELNSYDDYDGQYYRITISIGKDGTVNTVYNFCKIKKDSLPHTKIKSVYSGSKANSESNKMLSHNGYICQ